jgi:hypothetical protein
MAQCVVISGGAVVESLSDPCTGFLLLTPTEYGLLNNSPLNLSLEDGVVLSVGIIACWAAAYGWRAAVRALGDESDRV